jgi:hypothetical protein
MRAHAPALITSLAIIVMIARLVSTYQVFNDVIDEPYHIGAGIGMFESKRHAFGIQHPPLPRLVGALPLVLAGVGDEIARGTTTIQPDLSAFEVGHRVLLRGELSYWSALTRARAAMLVFPVVAVLYVYLLGSYLGSPLIGAAAAVLFSTDPTLLGHASWVTTDAAACAGYLAATYHGIRMLARPTLGRSLAAGVALGLAVACKFSCALVIIALVVIFVARRQRMPRIILPTALALCTGFVTLWGTYFFDVGTLRGVPVPMPSLFRGVQELLHHNAMGHFNYRNGQVSERGSWLYFPEAIVLKSPVALLFGLAVAIVVFAMSRNRRPQRIACIAIPTLVFLLASMMSQINIGIRHVLPVIPFICLFIAMQLAGRRALMMIVVIVAAYGETLWVHPDYLAFFNRFAGGPLNGEKFLLDSNLDWGQDQARLKTWLETNARGRTVTTRLFGNPRLYEWPHDGFDLLPPEASPRGLFAISRNYAYDVYPSPVPMSGVRRLTPVARIGYSIDVYDLTQMDSSPGLPGD